MVDCALEHRILDNPGGGYSGAWSFDLAPWTRAPMEALSSELYELVVIMGSSQSAKSEVINNWILWTVIDDPANFILLHPTKEMMRDFVVSRIDPMIRLAPEMRRLQRTDRSADNIFSKRFRGCNLWFAWPVVEQLSARSAPRWAMDDSDRIAKDVDGQGSAEELLAARQITFEGRAVGLKASLPSLGKRHGIETDFERGTAQRWQWPCPSCGEYFEPAVECLDFKRDGTPDEARETARLICPANGCVIEHRSKRDMNARGVWVGPDQVVAADGAVTGPARETRVASFAFGGLFGFESWGRLAERWRRGELAWETRQDEAPLRAFFNTGLGLNYMSQLEDAEPLEAEAVGARRAGESYTLGTVPAAAQCLTAAVDVQGNRFEVAVWAWRDGLECWLVDRFAILEAEGGRKIEPGRYPEHWAALLPRVIWRKYPVAGGGEARIASTAIDTGGVAGVSDNATKFWHLARRAGVTDGAVTLVKGGNNPDARLVSKTYLETNGRGQPLKHGASVWIVNVNRFKDIANARLRRAEAGPGYIHSPADLADEYVDELTAEEKQGAFWVKIRPRNETLDLWVYAPAAVVRHGGESPSLGWIPDGFRIVAEALDLDRAAIANQAPPAPPPVSHNPANAVRRTKRVISRGVTL